ncbi:hypothetical protein DPMN_193845 [Dreissena polymorpha]|uniref:Uncharacterized protein n=1 Tax=Dreissena polymorpha TaxID=45954 RepID=A0A9D4B818_DREPO|nr:hypothetical protein DPMN_193845 [Dreissena polymorpha]
MWQIPITVSVLMGGILTIPLVCVGVLTKISTAHQASAQTGESAPPTMVGTTCCVGVAQAMGDHSASRTSMSASTSLVVTMGRALILSTTTLVPVH